MDILGDLVDKILSDYAYTLDQLMKQVTPYQLIMMSKAIDRRLAKNLKIFSNVIRISVLGSSENFDNLQLALSGNEIKEMVKLSTSVPGFSIIKKERK